MSYLNTWPLVWGFIHGPQQGIFEFRFDLPSICAQTLESGEADIGLVPSAEIDRLGLEFFPRLGIATNGKVRSILLISRVPFAKIRRLAADSSSRTSVALVRHLLREQYGCEPEIHPERPALKEMLLHSDAALIIGDPALRIDPLSTPYEVMDLGEEWVRWCGLPMVFAAWAGKLPVDGQAFEESYRWGRGHIDDMIEKAERDRGFPPDLTRQYLTGNIVYELGPRHLEGLALFRRLALGKTML